ncbi:MAG: O-acetyl-ADP-ribose deacetylase [Kiritimatiellae bacterium]|nr:O-acetyl-ADP-ribose deacetylase [Kiritimatiellia bacterium]
MTIQAIRADITTLDVDAIVNAANTTLLGGGGVDGAIHRAAGPGLLAECLHLGGCPTGEARITGGHRLRARHVIHTVGPVWRPGSDRVASLLADCYRHALFLAAKHGIRSIAFPCISTGAYGYPPGEAADIAVRTVRETLATRAMDIAVMFCCFDERDLELYRSRLADVSEDHSAH